MMKYEMIANEVRNRILDGIYPVDSLIPDQVTLSKEFGVSRMTVKKALDILAMEGMIYRQRGSGTYVMKSALQNREDALINEYEGLTKQLQGHKVKSRVIQFTVEFPSKKVMECLMLEKNQPVYNIIRLRIVDELPYVLEHTYMPAELAVGLTEDILEKSVYDYIHQQLGLKFGGAFRKIHADKPSSYDKEYLGCQADDPVLEVEQIVYLKDGRPLEYSRSRHRYDTRSYTIVDVHPNR